MPLSMNGNNYLCVFTDLSCRLSTTVYLKTKSEFKQIYYDYLQYIRNKTGNYPKYVHADGGGEFINTEVKELNRGTGITFTRTAPHSSEQNPVAERVNRTLSEGSLTFLVFANLPLIFWEYSISCFNYIKIRTPHKHLNLSNPLTEWNIYNAAKCHIDLYDIRIFGCEAYVLDEDSLKNTPKAYRCIYLGPSEHQKCSYFYNIHTKKIIYSRNFILNETCFPGREIYPDIYAQYIGTTSTTATAPPSTNLSSSLLSSSSSSSSSSYSPSSSSSSSSSLDGIPDDAMFAMFSLNVPNVQTPFESGSETYVNVETNLSSFNRQTNQRVGPADLPSLPGTSSNASSGQSSQSSHSPELPVHSINGDAAYEIVEVLDKRKTRFGPKNQPKKGYDYKVRWKSNGNNSYPDSWVPQRDIEAKHLIRTFEQRQKEGNQQEAQPDIDTTSAPSSVLNGPSLSSPGLCNYVYIAFLAVLSGCKITNSDQSWKNIRVPNSRAEMLRSPEREQWLQAEREELKGIEEMKTWTRVSKPNRKPISCRWVYKLKPPTSVQPHPIFKCRLVVHGYKQQAEIDFTSTFAQVATMKAFRILLWLGVLLGLTATQLDIKQAFLYGKVDAEIYLSGIPGYENIGCVKLERSLYGIRQAPKIWYDTLISEFHNLGFVELISDTCVFKHPTQQCYLLIFVDDIVILTRNENFRQRVVSHLESKFKLKDMGLLRHFIGLQVDYDEDGTTHIHQGDYAGKICDTFDDNDSTRRTPCEDNQKFSVPLNNRPRTTTNGKCRPILTDS